MTLGFLNARTMWTSTFELRAQLCVVRVYQVKLVAACKLDHKRGSENN